MIRVFGDADVASWLKIFILVPPQWAKSNSQPQPLSVRLAPMRRCRGLVGKGNMVNLDEENTTCQFNVGGDGL